MAKTILSVDQFNPSNVELWFTILESRFVTAELTDDIKKYHCVIGSLSTDILEEEDIELNPYELLKRELIRVYSAKRQSDSNKVVKNQSPSVTSSLPTPSGLPAAASRWNIYSALNEPPNALRPQTTVFLPQLQEHTKKKRKWTEADCGPAKSIRINSVEQQTESTPRIKVRVDLTGAEPCSNNGRPNAVESLVGPRQFNGAGSSSAAGRLPSQMTLNEDRPRAPGSNGPGPSAGQWVSAVVLPNNRLNQAPTSNFAQPSTSRDANDALSRALHLLNRSGTTHTLITKSKHGRPNKYKHNN